MPVSATVLVHHVVVSVSDSSMQCDGSESTVASVSWTLEANDCPVTHYNISWTTTVLWNGEEG